MVVGLYHDRLDLKSPAEKGLALVISLRVLSESIPGIHERSLLSLPVNMSMFFPKTGSKAALTRLDIVLPRVFVTGNARVAYN